MRALEVCLEMKYEPSTFFRRVEEGKETLEERWLVYVWRPPEVMTWESVPGFNKVVPRLWAKSYEGYEEALAAFNTVRGFIDSMKRHEVNWNFDPNKALYQSSTGSANK